MKSVSFLKSYKLQNCIPHRQFFSKCSWLLRWVRNTNISQVYIKLTMFIHVHTKNIPSGKESKRNEHSN